MADTSAAFAASPLQLRALDAALLQFRSAVTGRTAAERDPHAIAASGMNGEGAPLPHLDRIQASFGRHDVSGVAAYTGPAANQATRGLNARAYASGDSVVLGEGGIDLHTVAHEAAHVIQQRGGVALKSGVGRVGDRYERHADAVADAVVAGRSAEPLLDQFAGTSGGGSAVQLHPEETFTDEEAEPVTAERDVAGELRQHVQSVVEQAPGWITHINSQVNPLYDGNSLVGIDPALNAITRHYASAKGTHDEKVAAGNRRMEGTMAAVNFALGLLPGLGDITSIMMPASQFMESVTATVRLGSQLEETTVNLGTRAMASGTDVAQAGGQRVLNSVRGNAESATTAPLTSGSPQSGSGESSSAFALRAQQTRSQALEALLRCAQIAANIAQLQNTARTLVGQLQGEEISDEQRRLASQINEVRLAWPRMQATVQRLTGAVRTCQTQVGPLETGWSPAQLEVYLWILWMHGLGVDNSSYLDPDPVENRLQALGIIGPGSITGVDFGAVTTVADEMEAQMAAARYVRSVRNALEGYRNYPLGRPS